MSGGSEEDSLPSQSAASADAIGLAEQVDDPVIAFDDSGTITFANDRVVDLLGLESATLRGRPAEFLLAAPQNTTRSTPHSTNEFLDAISDENGESSVAVDTASGTQWVRISSVDTATGYLCLLRSTEDVVRSGRTVEEPIEQLGDPVYVLDTEGQIQRVNDAMSSVTGYDREALTGRSVEELIDVADETRQPLSETGEGSATFEAQLITSDGDVILTEAHVTALPDHEDGGAICVLRDIRERKQRERDLALLKQLLARVFRHNVRNELTIVQTRVGLLKEQIEASLTQHTTEIMNSTRKMLGHSEKINQIAKVVEMDTIDEFDISDSVETLIETAGEDNPEVEIEAEVPSGSLVQAHPMVEAAIEELIENAIEHAPEEDSAQIEIRLEEHERYLTLLVEDESGGLEKNEINVLRRGAETDLEHGSGVGLWLVRWLVESSNAEMIAHRTDQGSLMGIRFRRADTESTDLPDRVNGSPVKSTPPAVRGGIPLNRFRGDIVVGREESLYRLEEIYESVTQTGGHTVLITGEAGIGKSTQIGRFCERLTQADERPLVSVGACELDARQPYHAFHQVFSDLPVGIELLGRISDATTQSGEDPKTVRQRGQQLFDDVADRLRKAATDQPVVLIIEDMQWADSGTISLFEYLVKEVGRWGHPVLFVGTYRTTDVGQPHPIVEVAEETTAAGRGTVLELEPLDTEDVERLLTYMLGVSEPPERFVADVYDHTGGTPLFVTEISRHVARELGPIESPADLPESLAELSIPESVESAVTERLAALPDRVRPLLHLGAIIGEEISFDVLRAATDLPDDRIVEYVDSLVNRHIWNRDGETLTFVHGVVREQTLEAIDGDRLSDLHGRVAVAIETVTTEETAAHASRLAQHHEQAGNQETAFAYHRQAGDHAAEQYAHDDAVENYERAMTLADDAVGVEASAAAAVHAALARVLRVTGKTDDARETLEAGLEVVPPESRVHCRLLSRQADVQTRSGEYEQARETAHYQREVAASTGARNHEADALVRLGWLARLEGKYDQGREYCEQSLAIAQEVGDRQCELKNLNTLGVIAKDQNQYDRAREYQKRCVDIAREIDNSRREALALTNLGATYDDQANLDQAQECYTKALDIAREVGDRHQEALALNNLGVVADKQSEFDRSQAYTKRSLEAFREIGNRKYEALCLHNLGATTKRQAEYVRARDYYQQSLEIRREIGDRRGEARTLLHLGSVARWLDAQDRAQEHIEQALEMADELGIPRFEATGLRRLCSLARESENHKEAESYIQESISIQEAVGDPRLLTEILIEQTRLALERGDMATARESVREAGESVSSLEATYLKAKAELLRGRIAAEGESEKSPRKHWQEAFDTFERIETPQEALQTLVYLIEHCREHDDRDEARRWCRQARDLLSEAPGPVCDEFETQIHRYATALDLG